MVGRAVSADERRSVVEREAARQRHHELRVNAGMRREAAHSAECRHRITDLELRHAVADGIDDARVFGARNERERRLDLVLVLNDQQIREIQARGSNRHPHLAGLRLGRRQFLPRECFRADRVVANPGVHGVISLR